MTTIKKLPHKEFLKIYSKVPRLCVDLIVKTKEGILLIKRDIEPAKGKWHLPGGTILMREKISDTIKRVSQEETGLKLKIIKILGLIEYRNTKSVFGHTISIVFLALPKEGTLRGGIQGKDLRYFNKIPLNTIKEQVIFLRRLKILK